MKSFSFIISALLLSLNTQVALANDEEKPHLSAVGPERDLGIILKNCNNYNLCGLGQTDEYLVCYYGIPFISEPQQTCWRNTPSVTVLRILFAFWVASNAVSALKADDSMRCLNQKLQFDKSLKAIRRLLFIVIRTVDDETRCTCDSTERN